MFDQSIGKLKNLHAYLAYGCEENRMASPNS